MQPTVWVTAALSLLPLVLAQPWVAQLDQQTTGQLYTSAQNGSAAVEQLVAGFAADPLLAGAAPLVPEAVLLAADVQDVQAAVLLAYQNNLTISVRGGGHWQVSARAAGEVVIDLSGMQDVEVDVEGLTLTAQGGATGGDMLHAAMQYELGLPWGDAYETGMGLALGGGIGMAMRQHGLTCDSILGAQLVLANGTLIRVDEDEHPELLPGLRGAGTAFGVVTEVTFKLFEGTADVYAGNLILPDNDDLLAARALLDFTQEAVAAYPGLGIEVWMLPGMGPVPALAQITVNFFGDESMDEKAAVFAPLRKLGPVADLLGPSILTQVPNATTQFNAVNDFTGAQYQGMNVPATWYLSAIMSEEQYSNGGIDAIIEGKIFLNQAANVSFFLADWMGPGTVNTTSFTPFAGAYMHFFFDIYMVDTAAEAVVAEELQRILAPHVTGFYPYANLANDPDPEPGLAFKVGGTENLRRLQHLKYLLDPDNLFVHHQLQGLVPASSETRSS